MHKALRRASPFDTAAMGNRNSPLRMGICVKNTTCVASLYICHLVAKLQEISSLQTLRFFLAAIVCAQE